jgi:hypothetical protein
MGTSSGGDTRDHTAGRGVQRGMRLMLMLALLTGVCALPAQAKDKVAAARKARGRCWPRPSSGGGGLASRGAVRARLQGRSAS